MSDIIERIKGLRYVHVPQASQLFEEAIAEIARLRGEVALWQAAATLTPQEADTLSQAVAMAAGSRLGDRLRWLLERLTDCKDSMPAL